MKYTLVFNPHCMHLSVLLQVSIHSMGFVCLCVCGLVVTVSLVPIEMLLEGKLM